MEGIYLINKPTKITSYDVIRTFKKVFKGKIGHAGTLDPLANGLVIILTGKATKLANEFLEFDKVYEGEITLGSKTTTYDALGDVLEELSNFNVENEEIVAKMQLFNGEILQKPPIYSALKVKGRKLYDYARKNEEVKIKKRKVIVHEFYMTNGINNNKFNFLANVSKGTYIRSLANDLGEVLNIPSHLSKLTRTKIDKFELKDAYEIKQINENITPTISLEDYLGKYPKLNVDKTLENLVLNGIHLTKNEFKEDSPLLVYNNKNELLAYYEPYNNKYKPIIIWSKNDSN